jgi:hypothetical protein
MKRYAMPMSIFVLVLAILFLKDQPIPTAAGGLPCFMCHGGHFEGSDLAPSVANTKLTDEEIMKQIRDPRGVMPAFPEFASQDIVDLIRTMPTGQPTAVLPAEQRSAALATLAAVAAVRATRFAAVKLPGADATPIPSPTISTHNSPTPSGSAASVSSGSATGLGNMGFPASANLIVIIVGLLIVSGSAWWIWQRRKTARL